MKTLIKPVLMFKLAVLAATAAGFAGAAPSIEPGEWKTTVQTDMGNANIPGLPAGIKLPGMATPMTHTACLKPEPGKDLGQQLADSANRNREGMQCTMLENNTSGNHVRYKMRCAGPAGEATISGDFTVEPRRYQGKTHMQMQSPMGPMQMSSTVSGEYVGPCKTAK